MAAQKKWHVGAKREPDGLQLCLAEPQVPEPVEREQGGGRVGGTAAHAGLCGNALGHPDVDALAAARGGLQCAGCAHDEVLGGQGRATAQVFARHGAIGAALEVQRVAPVHEHEHRLQQVVAVGAAARDVQEQVEFGRCGHVVERLHGQGRISG